MAQKVHYEEDIFFVRLLLRTLSQSNRIDFDKDLFSGKILEDLLFLHNTTERLYHTLMETPRLVRRSDYLRLLLGGMRELHSLLENENMQATVSEDLKDTRLRLAENIQELERYMHEHEPSETESGLISEEEIRGLLDFDAS
ncbi:MAG: hypothetical protein K9L68_02720 [Spirochaetales bacterium]|nr:hypothetical protein [Spirochaetales bacterium]MCF7937490.1 hypothetical protein [Spirochaetales bacterium]